MSEYQYYEFTCRDRPLTDKQLAELRAISTRATITRVRFVNEYNFGDLRAEPHRLMARYFDAHKYLASWGSARLMLRLEKAKADVAALRPYFAARRAIKGIKLLRDHVVLDFNTDGDERELSSDERVSLAALTPLRTELMDGDLRSAYLAWLIGLENGEYADRTREPPVPPGLAKRTRAQNALIRFLGISPYVVDEAVRTQRADGTRRTVGQLLAGADARRAKRRRDDD